MKFLILHLEPILRKFSAQPTENIHVDCPHQTENDHNHNEKYVRMGHFLIIRIWRLPLPLKNHDSHDQKKHPLANIRKKRECIDRRSIAFLAHIVNIIMVQKYTIEEETDRP